MAQECPHIEEVNFSNVLSELQALFNGELSHKQLFTGPEIQEAKENWVCIDNHCEKRADCIIDSAQLLEHKHKYDAKLYINLFTLEIVCFKCNLEILDEMFTTDPLEKLLKFKARVKDLITTLITKTLGIRAFSTATISGIKHLGMPSLVYSYPVFFYLLWSVPYFRFVLKRIYLLELQNIASSSSCLLGSTMFKFARIIFHIDSDQPLETKALQQAIFEFSEKNQAYRVTGHFDVFEALSDFLSFAHIQLSNSNVPGKSSLISSPTLRKLLTPQDEDKSNLRNTTSMEELMLSGQNSAFFNGISGDILTKMTCNQCGLVEEKQDNFMSLNFKLLQEEHVIQIRKRFASEGYYEGLVTKTKENKNWKLFKIFTKKKEEPVLTIRDYLCYLNLIQTFQLSQFCTNCKEAHDHTVTKLLQKTPEILIVGFSDPEEGTKGFCLDFKVDLEFDISPFVSQAENKYELIAMIAKESTHFGLVSDTIYLKSASGKWLKVDMYGCYHPQVRDRGSSGNQIQLYQET